MQNGRASLLLYLGLIAFVERPICKEYVFVYEWYQCPFRYRAIEQVEFWMLKGNMEKLDFIKKRFKQVGSEGAHGYYFY